MGSRRSPRLNIKVIPEASPMDYELTPDAPNEGVTDIQSMPNTLRDVEMAQQQKGFMSRFNFHTPRFLNAFKKPNLDDVESGRYAELAAMHPKLAKEFIVTTQPLK